MSYMEYTRVTGSAGIMMIRVADGQGVAGVINGNDVQFFIRADDSATFVGSPGFRTTAFVNGVWYSLNNLANYSGGSGYRFLGSINAPYGQEVIFHIDASGTSGFGGPTNFSIWIARGTVPEAPSPLGIDQVGHKGFRYRFTANGNGGSPILGWEVAYGFSQSHVQYTAGSSGTIFLTPFPIGSTVYIWSRGRNSNGWGPYSERRQVTLKAGVRVRKNGIWTNAIPYVKKSGIWVPAEPYVKRNGVPGVSDGTWTKAKQ